MMDTQFDCVIIGAGHNGLVCASYLAAKGLKVALFERRPIVGGAAVTEEFYPEFRNSLASYTVSLLHPKIIKDLNLVQHGLNIVERPLANFLPLGDDQYLKSGPTLEATQNEVAKFSQRDADQLPHYFARLDNVADIIRELMLKSPVHGNFIGDPSNLLTSIKLALKVYRLDQQTQKDLFEFFTKSAGSILDSWFESDPIKALFGFDSIVGNYASPYTPGSAYVLLHHVIGEVNGQKGVWGHAIGGMGAITQAMAQEAIKRGVKIYTDQGVSQVNIENDKVTGITLESGDIIASNLVVSNVNPKLLYLKLIQAHHLNSGFLKSIENYYCASGTFRMNVALNELPDFQCLPGKSPSIHHQSGIIIAPSLQYMEQAYLDAKQSGWSKAPIVECLIPSTLDDSLAPGGKHVASLFCQHFDPHLKNRHWPDVKEDVADLIINTVTQYAPNFTSSIIAKKSLSPFDLENILGLVGGDIFHGALSLDQLYQARPIFGFAQYQGPISGLYMCGSGTHPGGGVSGCPGHNAAQVIIKNIS